MARPAAAGRPRVLVHAARRRSGLRGAATPRASDLAVESRPRPAMTAKERAAAATAATSSVRGMRWVRTRRRAPADAASRPTSAALESAPTISSGRSRRTKPPRAGNRPARPARLAPPTGRSRRCTPAIARRRRTGTRGWAAGGGAARSESRTSPAPARCSAPAVEHVRAGHDLRSIEGHDGVEGASRRVHRHRRQRDASPRPVAEDRVQVGAMVGVAMADQHRIEAGHILGA